MYTNYKGITIWLQTGLINLQTIVRILFQNIPVRDKLKVDIDLWSNGYGQNLGGRELLYIETATKLKGVASNNIICSNFSVINIYVVTYITIRSKVLKIKYSFKL